MRRVRSTNVGQGYRRMWRLRPAHFQRHATEVGATPALIRSKMKTLSRYEFINDKAFEMRYLNASDRKRANVPDVDGLALVIETAKDERTTYHLRPDEALILARMLTDAVWKTCSSFRYGLIRRNRFKEDS